MNINYLKKSSGFTLLEIITVIGIIGILSGSIILGYNKILDDNSLYDATERLLFVMQQSIEESKQNVGDSRHGVYFDTNNSKFYSFMGDNYSSSSNKLEYELPERIEIDTAIFYNELGNNHNEISFQQGTGIPSLSNGLIIIQIKNRPEKYVTFNMNSEGIWSVTENL